MSRPSLPPDLPRTISRLRDDVDELKRRRLEIPEAEESTATGADMPFVVVADDGSGDYTSIKTAIETELAVTISRTLHIWVKPHSTGASYTDTGAGRVELFNGGKVFIYSPLGMRSFGGGNMQAWAFDGFNDDGYIYVHGLQLVGTGAMRVIPNAGSSVDSESIFDNCVVPNFNLFDTTGTKDTQFVGIYNCYWAGSLFGGSGTRAAIGLEAENSQLQFGGTTFDFLGSWLINNCTITFAGNTIFQGPALGGGDIQITGCQIPHPTSGSRTVSFRSLAVAVVGCTTGPSDTSPTNTITLNVQALSANWDEHPYVAITGNAMFSTIVDVDATNGPSVYISGLYQRLILDTSQAHADVHLHSAERSSITLLTVTGDNNVIIASFTNGSGSSNTPYNFNAGADGNLLLSRQNTFTNPGVDSGSGNSINALPPSGAAGGDLAGTFPSPTLGNAVRAAAGTDVLTAEVTGDTNRRWTLNADGSQEWGPGNAGADTVVQRDAANVLGMAAGDVFNAPVRRAYGPWYQDAVVASQAAVQLAIVGSATRLSRLATRAGSVTGIVVRSDAARVAGTLTVDVTINGAPTGVQAILDGTNTTVDTGTQQALVDNYVAGDEIGVELTTDAGWLPITANITVDVETVE